MRAVWFGGGGGSGTLSLSLARLTNKQPLRPPPARITPQTRTRAHARTCTSSRRTKSWLGCGMCSSNTASATLTSSGCATHVPSCPARTSRSLSARTCFVCVWVGACGGVEEGRCWRGAARSSSPARAAQRSAARTHTHHARPRAHTQPHAAAAPAQAAAKQQTLASAASLAAASCLIGICAAMPPIAWQPRAWHVRMSRRTYASMNGLVIVTSPRLGSTLSARLRNFLMNENT